MELVNSKLIDENGFVWENNIQTKEVTREEFYATVGQLNVAVGSIGRPPYTSLFKLRNGNVKGIVISKYKNELEFPEPETHIGRYTSGRGNGEEETTYHVVL